MGASGAVREVPLRAGMIRANEIPVAMQAP